MGSITLHPEKGLNPRMTYCQRCGEDVGIVLLGANNKIITCNNCKTNNVGRIFGQPCGKCGERLSSYKDKWRVIEEDEKIPGGLCDECLKEVKEHEQIVLAGGIYWKCEDCGQSGAIKRNAYTLELRKAMGRNETEPCGVIFDKINCPAHCEKTK